jgi:uncharacterized membrane protein
MEHNTQGGRAGWVLGFAALLMLIAGAASLNGSIDSKSVTYFVSIAVAMIFVSIMLLYRRRDEPVHDERTRRVSQKALSYSWWFTYVLIAGMMLVENFGLAKLSVEGVLGITFFFMVASQYLFRWHLNRKGDAE